jgi:predicted aspartyl protease
MGAFSTPNILLAQEVKDLNIDTRSARVSFLSSQRSSGVLELKFDAALHLRVAARINGVDASAIVDSGAGRTIIDSTFASKNGLLLRTGFNVAGITGNTHGHFADGMNITLGKLVIEDLPAGVLDLNPKPNGVDDAVDVILGREFFENVAVDIDIESKSIVFEDPNKKIELNHGNPSVLKRTPRGTPYFPISINNDAPISAAFDLGYNGTILVSADYAEKTGLLTGRPVSTVASRGVEGLSISRVVTLDKVKIAGVELENVPMEVPADWNRTIPAIIGFELLNRFHIVTDYRRSQIWLSPYKSKIDLPIPKDRSGIGAIPTKFGLKVLHVAEGSPAESAGLKPGDQIVKIDGEHVDSAYIVSHPRMGARPAGTKSELTLSDGRMIHLTLADYY